MQTPQRTRPIPAPRGSDGPATPADRLGETGPLTPVLSRVPGVPGPSGSASVRGLRRVAADATAVQGVGAGLALAVADGIGDSADAARAAHVAADVAAAVAPRVGSFHAVLAAGDAVRADCATGDTVLVVAAGLPDGGWSVSWVGDSRALLVTERDTEALTHDHTVAEYFRERGETPGPRWENVVTTTVRTATADQVGTARGPAVPGTLVLLSDGIHRTLDPETIGFLVRRGPGPARAARALVDAALAAGTRDNATATVVPLPREWR
ncbi:hypothetical protein GCM10009836_31270 [Pseudonocardia ailaonensis]|uniref:PPM-type phosphatase domain-containing protein n=1 Tax=Pseudonocardia ailaonensis TaxID=367279 RepID=A0ABN2N3Z9_9PSEU